LFQASLFRDLGAARAKHQEGRGDLGPVTQPLLQSLNNLERQGQDRRGGGVQRRVGLSAAGALDGFTGPNWRGGGQADVCSEQEKGRTTAAEKAGPICFAPRVPERGPRG